MSSRAHIFYLRFIKRIYFTKTVGQNPIGHNDKDLFMMEKVYIGKRGLSDLVVRIH